MHEQAQGELLAAGIQQGSCILSACEAVGLDGHSSCAQHKRFQTRLQPGPSPTGACELQCCPWRTACLPAGGSRSQCTSPSSDEDTPSWQTVATACGNCLTTSSGGVPGRTSTQDLGASRHGQHDLGQLHACFAAGLRALPMIMTRAWLRLIDKVDFEVVGAVAAAVGCLLRRVAG